MEEKIKNNIKEFVNKLETTPIHNAVITTHRNADPDAIASAYTLSKLIEKVKANVKVYIILPEGLSALSKRLIEYLNVDIKTLSPKDVDSEFWESVDTIFIVDTCSLEQLGPLKHVVMEKYGKLKVFIVDHHFAHKNLTKLAYTTLILSDARSTTEIIFTLYESLGLEITETIANLMLAGIVYDTRHFILARPETFNIVASLIRYGAKYATVLKALQTKMEIPERIARLKAAQRMQIYRINEWIIVVTHVGAYEASAARALLDLGADVAFVASEDKGEVRVSARAKEEFYKGTGVHLGKDIMKPLGEFLQGGGGGHETAAAASGRGSAELALIKCIELLKNHLKQVTSK